MNQYGCPVAYVSICAIEHFVRKKMFATMLPLEASIHSSLDSNLFKVKI